MKRVVRVTIHDVVAISMSRGSHALLDGARVESESEPHSNAD